MQSSIHALPVDTVMALGILMTNVKILVRRVDTAVVPGMLMTNAKVLALLVITVIEELWSAYLA